MSRSAAVAPTALGPRLALWALGLSIVGYGNTVPLLSGWRGVLRDAEDVAPFALLVVVVLGARALGLSADAMGFRLGGWWRGMGWGALAGAAMAAPALAFFAFPVIMAESVVYSGYQPLELGALAGLLLVRLPLRTALVEEAVFRGFLQARAVQLLGLRGGLALTCALFVLWHGVITYQTIGLTNLDGSPLPAWGLWALSALPLAAAGLIFSWLRLKTGSLAAPLAAHWVVNASIALFLTASS